MELRLSSILTDATKQAVETQRTDGSFPPGSNGPYNDTETPVRTTSHWLVTLSRLGADRQGYDIDSVNRSEFKDAANVALEYLKGEDARPDGATFEHRHSRDKDNCNGLIGQAWTIESLVAAYQTLDDEDALKLAEEVFLLHPFDENTGLWRRVDTDGTLLGFDRTFNHQLWFAAAGGELAAERGGRVDEQVRRFLDQLPILLDVTKDGQVRHLLSPSFSAWDYLRILFDSSRRELVRNALLGPVRPPSNRRNLRRKAIGYQSFNLYALAMLHERYPDNAIWENKAIDRALEYASSEDFREAVADNPYGYPYNVSGIELAYSLSQFGTTDAEENREWLLRQFERTYNLETGRMDRNNPDPVTLTARLYEATRLKDTVIQFDPS